MFARTDQDMRGSLRGDIFEGKKFGIFVDQFRRQFAFADLAKNAVIHRPKPPYKSTESTPFEKADLSLARQRAQKNAQGYPLVRDDNVETKLKASSICLLLQPVQSHHERIVEAPLPSEQRREALCVPLRRQAPHTHTVEASRWRCKILHEHRVAAAQIRSQPVRVLALLKCPDLNRESTRER